MAAKPEVLEKLYAVSEKEWLDIAKMCKEHINLRIGHKTLFGAHSEARLGMPTFNFYFNGAVDKLYTGVWEWKFNKLTLQEQLVRIINSMISEEVRKVRTKKEKNQTLRFLDMDDGKNEHHLEILDDLEETKEQKQRLESFAEVILEAIAGNFEYEYICLSLREGKSYDQIAVDCSMEKKELYKKVELLKRKANRIAAKRGLL